MSDLDDMPARYARRSAADDRYSLLQPDVRAALHERQRALLDRLRTLGWQDGLHERCAVEVGCGGGQGLLELLRIGFAPERLTGIELLPERCAAARRVLPAALRLIEGDATQADVPPASCDLVLQSTVFSSLLAVDARQRLADAMWRWLKPGGGVAWYDFTVDNPRNPDVRGVPVAELRGLFPTARIAVRRVTLAPPLARAVCRVHPGLYPVFNAVPLLRTHVFAWIEKPA